MGNWGSKNTSGVHRMGNRVYNRGSMVNNLSSMNNRSSMVNNWGMVNNRSGMVNNWCSMDSRCSSIASYSLISDINNVTRVSISAIVNHLSSTVRKSNSVVTRSRVTISLFLLGK